MARGSYNMLSGGLAACLFGPGKVFVVDISVISLRDRFAAAAAAIFGPHLVLLPACMCEKESVFERRHWAWILNSLLFRIGYMRESKDVPRQRCLPEIREISQIFWPFLFNEAYRRKQISMIYILIAMNDRLFSPIEMSWKWIYTCAN